jgi:hypothetical protein
MAMNTKKILVGGLAAGLVLNIIDYLAYGVLLADRMKSEMDAFKPGLSEMMGQGNSIIMAVVTDFVVGILLVWTYAAIRPRFGPGPSTAAAAAVLFWFLGSLFNAGYLHMGMMSMSSWWMLAIIWLVNLLLGAFVGAKLYTEEGGATRA